MKIIQFILVPALFFLVIVYFRRFRTLLWDRLIVFFIGTLGIVLVLKPDWTSRLANDLGVGRGADLLSYVGFIGFGFLCLMLWAKIREMEARLTSLTRTLALKNFQEPAQKPKTNP